MGKNLTLEEIGLRAGVSRSTVSRVLNNHPDVRASVRQRVEKVIAETGFVPNQAARALVSNRNGLIGLVMLTEADELFGDPYYSALVDGIQDGCREHNLIFSIFPVLGTGARANLLTTQIAQGFVDGVIVTAGQRSEHVISTLRDRGVRLVVIGQPTDGQGLLRIDVDGYGGSKVAVNHLIERGRSRIGFVGPGDKYVYGIERRRGYTDALTAAELSVDDRWARLAEPTRKGGYEAAAALLPEAPDAIFAATDTMALGVFDALTERGLRVPEDIAVVGFDGLPRSPVTEPRLTTVVQPVEDVGRAAVAALVGGAEPPKLVVLPTQLQLGESCGVAAR